MAEKQEYIPVTTLPGRPVQTPEKGQLWRQYLFAGIANISVVAAGYVMGWTSPINSKLMDPQGTPLPKPIDIAEGALIGSILTVGAMCGPFVGGPLSTRIGRKWSLMASGLPLLVGFILVTMAKSVAYLLAGRILWGLAIGMIFTISPTYCVEVATLEARGVLGSFLQLFIVMGFLLIYAVGPFVSYNAVSYVGFGIIAGFIGFLFIPESPKYCLLKGNRNAAAKSLMALRGRSRSGVEAELFDLTEEIDASMNKSSKFLDVFRGTNLKAFSISCGLLFFQQFCGINAVLFYMMDIFHAAGSSLDAAIATIIVGAVMVLGSCCTSLVVEKLGKRKLMFISTCGTTIGLGVLGWYFLLAHQESPLKEKLGLLPVISLIVFIFTYCLGLGPLPWAVMGELLPMEVKATASTLATTFCWIMSFLITRFFGPIAAQIGMHWAFWIFGVFCAIGFVFTLVMVPDTRGKTTMEIEDMLAGRKSSKKSFPA